MIEETYTLFTRIPVFRDPSGRYATAPLWHKDLVRHFDYIADFRLCCAVVEVEEHDPTLSYVEELSDDIVLPLRRDRGWGSVIANLIPNAFLVQRALSKTEIAHSGGAGWSFPLSYYILMLRPFLRFKWIFLLESSFYRMPKYGKASFRQIASHHIHTFLVRRCVQSADARIFTTNRFRDLFLGRDEASLVAPAIWIDDADILPLSRHLAKKPKDRRRARIVFPARLVPDKGVQTVLDAIRIVADKHRQTGVPVPQIDIIGKGEMETACRAVEAQVPDGLMRLHDPLPYGDAFFAFLQDYDAFIVANLQNDGQPRILYDAFGQGLPCIASETTATREAVSPGETGLFFNPGDPESLAACFLEVADQAGRLHEMGTAVLREMAAHTHQNMHRTREKFLKEVLGLARPDAEGVLVEEEPA